MSHFHREDHDDGDEELGQRRGSLKAVSVPLMSFYASEQGARAREAVAAGRPIADAPPAAMDVASQHPPPPEPVVVAAATAAADGLLGSDIEAGGGAVLSSECSSMRLRRHVRHHGHHHHHHHEPRPRAVHRDKEEHIKLWKTPKETALSLALAAEKKVSWPIDKYLTLCFMSGFFIGIGAIASMSIAALFAATSAAAARTALALTFPIALLLIVHLGGELFTGNCMYFALALLQRNVPWWSCLLSLVVSYVGNWAGCVFTAWLFGVAGDMFVDPPFSTYAMTLTDHKVLEITWGAVLVRAIGANLLVCFAVFLNFSAEDVASKILAVYLPVSAFVFAGFEHSIANMFMCSMGIFVGAESTYGQFIYKNLIPASIGNVIGGGFFVGVLIYYWYSFGVDPVAFPTSPTPVAFNFKKWSFLEQWKIYKAQKSQ